MRTIIIAACLLAGLAAAYTITASADSVTLQDLPSLGYSLSMQGNVQTGCNVYVVIGGNGVPQEIPIGDIPPVCVSADEQAARIDALLAAYPPAPTTTVAPTVSTVYETTTVQGVPLPAVTVASPPVEHTVTETVTQTVTVPAVASNDNAVVPEPEWLTALTVRSAFLNVVYGLV